MKQATLKDPKTNKVWNLTDLVEDHDEVSIGRDKTNIITWEANSLEGFSTVSRLHAVITYETTARLGTGFYIRDFDSKNGTTVSSTSLRSRKCLLSNGHKIFLGDYGPLVYEEQK